MYRTTIHILAEEEDGKPESDVMTGELVNGYEEYLTACTDAWYRLQRILAHRKEEVKE
jgi:hypothetical protein